MCQQQVLELYLKATLQIVLIKFKNQIKINLIDYFVYNLIFQLYYT